LRKHLEITHRMEQQSVFKKMFTGKRKYAVVGLLIIVILSVIAFRGNANNAEAEYVTVTRGSISEEVLLSGTVKPMESVDLAFEKSGTVSSIYKKAGDMVYSGQIIVSLENGTEQAALETAEADLESAKARFEELSKGSRPEEILVKESELAKSNQDLKNFYSSIPAFINDAYNKADSAVNKQSDPIFSNDQTSNPDLTFNVSNQQQKNDAVSARLAVTLTLEKFRTLNDSVLSQEKSQEEMDEALQEVRTYLLNVQSFLVKVSSALNSAINVAEATIATYKDNVATGRANVNTAIQSITGTIDDISSQKIAVEKIKRELEVLKLGSTAEVLSQQRSAIMKAEANVRSASSNLRKTIIRSPIDGILSKQDAKVGELASAGTSLVSVISKNLFKIEANLPEADLAKTAIGNSAIVTLDSYGNTVIFDAKIISMDPAETVIDGVSTYKTTFSLINPAQPVRSGMTANITIKTSEKVGVLILPQRAVTSSDKGRIVNVATEDGTEERIVTTGARGSDGMLEIVSGLNEGDIVALPGKK